MRAEWGPKLHMAQISICAEVPDFFFSCPLGGTVYSSMLLHLDLSTSLNLKVTLFGAGVGGVGEWCVYWERKYE